MTNLKEKNVEYIGFGSRSIHELESGISYYNYEGIHFRVFGSFDDAKAFLRGEPVEVIAEFDSEEDLDRFLEDLEDTEICNGCGKVCFLDDECYEDADTGDAYCTECCFYDESNDMYRVGTIEEHLYKVQNELEELKSSSVFMVQQFDMHINCKYADFGMFFNRDKAVEAMMNGFEELYPGFKDDVYENGYNQWMTDKFDFAVNITEVEMNKFGEL